MCHCIHFAVVQLLSHVQLFATPWNAAQVPLSSHYIPAQIHVH